MIFGAYKYAFRVKIDAKIIFLSDFSPRNIFWGSKVDFKNFKFFRKIDIWRLFLKKKFFFSKIKFLKNLKKFEKISGLVV